MKATFTRVNVDVHTYGLVVSFRAKSSDDIPKCAWMVFTKRCGYWGCTRSRMQNYGIPARRNPTLPWRFVGAMLLRWTAHNRDA